ncbi:MAG: hypothetical protein M1817_000398, partial [Caeruleum heppii]
MFTTRSAVPNTAAQVGFDPAAYHSAAIGALLQPPPNHPHGVFPPSSSTTHLQQLVHPHPVNTPADRPDMSILSAEVRDDSRYAQPTPARTRPSNQILGGFILNDVDVQEDVKIRAPGMSSHQQENGTRRSRKTNDDDAPGKKSRGRPRLDARDESATDRRRTQIRLAQRAYRLRKETTISELKKRVDGLEAVIDDMKQSFLAFHHLAVTSGIGQWRPELACSLEDTKRQLTSLAQIPSSNTEWDEDDQDEPSQTSEPNPAKSHISTSLGKRKTSSRSPTSRASTPPLTQESLHRDTPSSLNRGHAQLQRSSSFTAEPQRKRTRRDESRGSEVSAWSSHVASLGDRRTSTTSSVLRCPSPQRSLSPLLVNYSAQETQFGRRLLRAAMESAYRLLIDPNAPYSRVSEIFQFTLRRNNKEQIVSNLRKSLLQLNKESPELFEESPSAPPNRLIANTSTQSNSPVDSTNRSVAASPMSSSHSSSSGHGESAEDIYELDGGVMSAEEVERYLRERGMRFDNKCRVAELDLDGSTETSPRFPCSLQEELTVGSSGSSFCGGPWSPATPIFGNSSVASLAPMPDGIMPCTSIGPSDGYCNTSPLTPKYAFGFPVPHEL